MSTPAAVYKIILIGDAGVGKTSCLAKYKQITTKKAPEPTHPTIGVEFESFDFTFKGDEKEEKIKVQIWDTAGQERYRAITKSHYRRANGAMLFFDLSDKSTFTNARDVWWPELRDAASEATGLLNAITLVGNKKDLPKTSGSVDEEFLKIGLNSNFIASVYASRGSEIPHKFDKTSAKDGTGVKEAFEKLIDTIHRFHKNRQMYKRSEEVAVLDGSTVKKKSNTCTTCG
eukprot:g1317.t1